MLQRLLYQRGETLQPTKRIPNCDPVIAIFGRKRVIVAPKLVKSLTASIASCSRQIFGSKFLYYGERLDNLLCCR